MKKLLLMAAALCCGIFSFAQSAEIDSLKDILSAKEEQDSSTVYLLKDISAAYMLYDFDSSQAYAERAVLLADQIRFPRGKAFALRGLGNLLLLSGNYPESLENYEAALAIDDSIGYRDALARDWENIGIVSSHMENYLAALSYYLKALSVARAARFMSGQANILDNIASSYNHLGKLDSAVYYNHVADSMVNIYYDPQTKGELWINYGNICLNRYHKTKNKIYLSEARSAFAVALNIFPVTHYLFSVSRAHLSMAESCHLAGDSDSAFFFALLADSINRKYNYRSLQASAEDTLSRLFSDAGNYFSAYTYLQASNKAKQQILSQQQVLAVENLKFQEKLREEARAKALKLQEEREQMVLIAVFIILFFLLVVYISRLKISREVVAALAVLSLLLAFEYVTLITHPYIAHLCKDIPVLMLIALVIIAWLMGRLHHILETIALNKLCPPQAKV